MRRSGTRLSIALAAGALALLGHTIGVGPASAALSPPAVTASGSGNTINISVTNPNPADPDPNNGILGSACIPAVVEYDIQGDRFTWVADSDFDPDDWPENEAEAVAIWQSRGIAAAGRTASTSVAVPESGLYVVGAVCQSDVDDSQSASAVVPVTIGSTSTGPAVTASAQGRTVTGTVSGPADRCAVVIAELTLFSNGYISPAPETPSTTTTVTVPRDGYYAVSGFCVDPNTETITYTKPAKVVRVPGGGGTPPGDQNCVGSICLP